MEPDSILYKMFEKLEVRLGALESEVAKLREDIAVHVSLNGQRWKRVEECRQTRQSIVLIIISALIGMVCSNVLGTYLSQKIL